MITRRFRYEHGHLTPLDPLPDLEEGDTVEIQWQGKTGRVLTDAYLTMLASEDRLRRLWDTPEEDDAWADL